MDGAPPPASGSLVMDAAGVQLAGLKLESPAGPQPMQVSVPPTPGQQPAPVAPPAVPVPPVEPEAPAKAEPTNKERRQSLALAKSAENIIICLDIGNEMASPWEVRDMRLTRLDVVKNALKCMVRRKASFNKKHKFALCTLAEEASWQLDFTSDMDMVVAALDSLQVRESGLGFDFSSLFDVIIQHAKLEREDWGPLPDWPGPGPGPQDCECGRLLMNVVVKQATRAIVVYGRSLVVPTCSRPAALLDRRGFWMDCLYVHKRPSEDGVCCQEVYDFLTQFESKDKHSYYLESGHSLMRINVHMAMLMAHPAQREQQEEFTRKMDLRPPDHSSPPHVIGRS